MKKTNQSATKVVLSFVRISLILFVLCGISQNFSSKAKEFDRQVMLNNIAFNILLPSHKDFVVKAGVLEQAVENFAKNPNLETLQTAQESWREASLQWQRCSLFKIGSLSIMLFHSQISKTPANIKLIEGHIKNAEKIDEAFIESIGSTSKGLPAIEYFLFSLEGNEAVLSVYEDVSPERLQYLVALAQNLSNKATMLYEFWLPEKNNFIENLTTSSSISNAQAANSDLFDALYGVSVKEPISMLANAMVAQALDISKYKIGRPSGKLTGTPIPEEAQARLSGISLEQIIISIETLQLTFNGADSLGFDDYLDFIGTSDSLTAKINKQFDSTLNILKKIDKPLSIAVVQNSEQVLQAYAEMRTLLILLLVDTANQLGVTITFGDDGD